MSEAPLQSDLTPPVVGLTAKVAGSTTKVAGLTSEERGGEVSEGLDAEMRKVYAVRCVSLGVGYSG